MAMTSPSARGARAEINVTPMIDILLVLLIIFMIVAPVEPRGLRALVPQPPQPGPDTTPRPLDIVITVRHNGAVELNQELVTLSDLPGRLARIFQLRGDAVIFLRGEQDLTFGTVAHVIDVARAAGLTRIGLMTAAPAPRA